MAKVSQVEKLAKKMRYVEKMSKNVKYYKKNLHESKLFTTFARYFCKIVPRRDVLSWIYGIFSRPIWLITSAL